MIFIRNALFVSLFVFTKTLYGINAVEKIKFVDELCSFKEAVSIDLRYENTAILMSVPRHTRGDLFNCRIRLLAHKGSSVVLSIYRYDIRGKDRLTIQDSDQHTVALIGSALFKDEKKSIISAGEMVVTYKRHNTSLTSGFQFTFTQVHESPCMSNEFACKNGKCILKDLACNGHNHCGDNSDNLKCVPETSTNNYSNTSKLSKVSDLWLTTLAVVALLLLILTVILIAVIIRNTRKLKTPTDNSSENPSDAPMPLQSVSASVPARNATMPIQSASLPARNAQQPTTDERQRSENAQPTESLYSRVRRSLRRNNASVEEVPTMGVHEVPSMYPDIDQFPTAPEFSGADNLGYKNEE